MGVELISWKDRWASKKSIDRGMRPRSHADWSRPPSGRESCRSRARTRILRGLPSLHRLVSVSYHYYARIITELSNLAFKYRHLGRVRTLDLLSDAQALTVGSQKSFRRSILFWNPLKTKYEHATLVNRLVDVRSRLLVSVDSSKGWSPDSSPRTPFRTSTSSTRNMWEVN